MGGTGSHTRSTRSNGEDVTATVFIVDDDPAVRAALSLLVESCGWRARSFATAEEFLDCYEREQPACLVLDLKMPGMGGVELQKIIADLDLELPVIVITAYHEHPLSNRARAAGALAVIGKPFREAELIGNIRVALGR